MKIEELQSVFNECIEEVEAIKIPIASNIKISINKRFVKRWGQCQRLSKDNYLIEISEKLVRETTPINSLKETIIHELLHTCNDCMNHGVIWKFYADKVNRCYTQYTISRTSTSEKLGVEELDEDYNYILQCTDCQHKFKYKRWSRVIANYDSCNCGCGGSLKRIK